MYREQENSLLGWSNHTSSLLVLVAGGGGEHVPGKMAKCNFDIRRSRKCCRGS